MNNLPLHAIRARQAIVDEVQERLDAFAQTRGYDDMHSLVTYATDPDPVFAAEGQRGVNLRSATWAAMRQIELQVAAGQRVVESIEDVEGELPALTWNT